MGSICEIGRRRDGCLEALSSLSGEDLVNIILDDARSCLAARGEYLRHRFYSRLNTQEFEITGGKAAIFRMHDCRLQSTRKRTGLPDCPCQTLGIAEYAGFAGAVDPRMRTRCLVCPPAAHPVKDQES